MTEGKGAKEENQPNSATLAQQKDDSKLIAFMDGVNSLVSDDSSKFDAEANDRIVALNKDQTDPAKRIDSIVRDDDEILITYQDGTVEPINRLDDSGNPKPARVISQELWRYVTDQGDDSFKYAADLYAKEPGGGFRSTTRTATAEEQTSFLANKRAVEAVGPAPTLLELPGKPTPTQVNENADKFEKESKDYALKLKAEIEAQGNKVSPDDLKNIQRQILNGGDASKYASLAPFKEIKSSSEVDMVMGETMVSPIGYMKDKLGPNIGNSDTQKQVQTAFSEVFSNFLPDEFKNGAKLTWDDSKNQVIITYRDKNNNETTLPPIQMSDDMGSRTSTSAATEMIRKAAVDVTNIENKIRQSRNRKDTRKKARKFNG
jgi:hypothetical protein